MSTFTRSPGGALLVLALQIGSATSAAQEAVPTSDCPESIQDVDMERFLDEHDGVEAEDCLGPVSGGPTVDLKSVQYGELDGETGLEAVVRAQTCVMGTGGSDVSDVLKLHCAADGAGWSLNAIPVEKIPYGSGPGDPRYAAYLEVDGTHLRSSQTLYRDEDASVEPSWERLVTYTFDGERFKIESVTVRALERRP